MPDQSDLLHGAGVFPLSGSQQIVHGADLVRLKSGGKSLFHGPVNPKPNTLWIQHGFKAAPSAAAAGITALKIHHGMADLPQQAVAPLDYPAFLYISRTDTAAVRHYIYAGIILSLRHGKIAGVAAEIAHVIQIYVKIAPKTVAQIPGKRPVMPPFSAGIASSKL